MDYYLIASNPIINAYTGSDFFGKLIFLGLLVLSILTWTLFIQKFLLQREARKKSEQMGQLFQKRKAHPLSIEIGEAKNPFANLYRTLKEHSLDLLRRNHSVLEADKAITLSRSDIELIEAHLTSAISSETRFMEKNLFVLSTVVSLAPFLGLLGTVWGILLTFAELQAGGAANANTAVIGGLAMALGTTVMGLLVAIPALIGYNYLRASIAHFSADMEDFSQLLLASVEFQYREIDVSKEVSIR